MKIFRTIRKHYAILGFISSLNPSTQKCPISKRVFFGLSSVGCLIVAQFVYIFCVANGFFEYMEAICATSVTIIIFVCIAAIALKRAALIEYYEKIEELIDTSKTLPNDLSMMSKSIFILKLKSFISGCKYRKSEAFFFKISEQIEQLSEIIFAVFVKVILQCIMLPKCFASFGIYYITDAGSDSFQLPFPTW